MRTQERIQKRVETTEGIIENLKAQRKVVMENIQKKIAENAGEPDYIMKWMDSWMLDAKLIDTQIQDKYKELNMLTWVLED
jgi:hypothetical protein